MNSLNKFCDVAWLPYVGLNDREFITPQSGNKISLSDATSQAIGNGLEKLISYGMAERIVYRLELINIDIEHGKPLTPCCSNEFLFKSCMKGHSIWKVCQCIVMGEMRDSF